MGLDEARDRSGPRDEVSLGHFIEQLEGATKVWRTLEVHIEEVVLEEEGGGEEGEFEEVGMDRGAEEEVGGSGAGLEAVGEGFDLGFESLGEG